MTTVERILHGDKEALIADYYAVAMWARNLTPQAWHKVTNDSGGGLSAVIRRTVDNQTHVATKLERNKIYDICIMVKQMTDAELLELQEIAHAQMTYLNPLKMATTAKENALGRHNQAVLDALLNLKAVIESGESI